MKHIKLFEGFLNETISKFPNISRICVLLWDGDITLKEAIKNSGLKEAELNVLELFLKENIDFFEKEEGVPDPEDNPKYKDMLEILDGAKFLQQLIDNND